jgi:hypothetical protein
VRSSVDDPVLPLVAAKARYPERVRLSIVLMLALDGHGSEITEPSKEHVPTRDADGLGTEE